MNGSFVVHNNRTLWLRRPIGIAVVLGAIIILATLGGVVYMDKWYQQNIKQLSTQQERIRVTIESGSDADHIGKLLEEKKVIRSARAFSKYVSKTHQKDKLQAGTYLLSPNQSVADIVELLVSGKVDTFNLTLVPGKRLDQIKDSLLKAGFDKAQLEAALAKKYDHPLLAGRPASASLEGYIFPDTYQLSSSTTPEQFLTTTFDTFYKKIQDEGLQDKLRQRGLTLYQGITLASIVQQEVGDAANQRIVAQVFLSRLQQNIMLGSDVTFMYASRIAGVADNVSIDSPYNTRRYKGLPPGPIGNFNMSALEAVANPAATDYLYFVAGDDGKVYYSHTEAEHQALVKQHCIKLCQ